MEKRQDDGINIELLAIILGLTAAWIDSIRTPAGVVLTATSLFLFCFILGLMRPDRALSSALITGGCVLAVFLARGYIDSVSLNVLKAIPTLIPALIGAYSGAVIRKVFSGLVKSLR